MSWIGQTLAKKIPPSKGLLVSLLNFCYSKDWFVSITLKYNNFLFQSIRSIIGATLKRLDTAAPVFTWGVAEFCTIFVYVF